MVVRQHNTEEHGLFGFFWLVLCVVWLECLDEDEGGGVRWLVN